MSCPTVCLAWVAVPVLRGEPSGPLGWHSGTQGRWGGGGTLECSHCLWKVGENSKYTACLCSLKAGSCIRRGEELKYLQTALSSPCSPKLSSRTSRGQKSFCTAQSWTHEAPLSWTDTGKCWVSPVPPKVHLSLTQCQTPNFLKEISGEGGGGKSYIFDVSTLRRPLRRFVRKVLCRLNMGIARSGRCVTNTCCLDRRDVQGSGRSAGRCVVLGCRPRQNMSSAANRHSCIDRCSNFHSSSKI